MTEEEASKGKAALEDQSEGSGQPEEVSEEEEVVSVSPLTGGSCVCVKPVREPLEVGENEDCSQAVCPGTPGTCSCGGIDGEEPGKEERSPALRGDNGGNEDGSDSIKSERGTASLVSLSPPLLHTAAVIPPSSPLPELCPSLSQVGPESRAPLPDKSLGKREDLNRLVSTDSTSTENSTALAVTLVKPLVASSSVGDLYSDKTPDISSLEQGQGLYSGDSRGKKLSSMDSELECTPESLHSQLAEPSLTSGW